MRVSLGAQAVQAPTGQEWHVGRRWITRRLPQWRKIPLDGNGRGKDAAEAVFGFPNFGDLEDLGAILLVIAALAVFALILIPLLLFGIELIGLGLLIAAGIAGRTLLGRPWVVMATSTSDAASVMSWRVVGWRRSARLIDEVASALATGLDPAPAEAVE